MQDQIITRHHRRQQTGFHISALLLGKHVARFAQRPGHHGFPLRGVFQRPTIPSQRGDMVIAAVHRRAHQIVEARIDQHKVTATHLFYAAYLCYQHAGFRDQKTTRLYLKRDRVPQVFSNLLTRSVPQSKVVIGIDRLFTFAIRD